MVRGAVYMSRGRARVTGRQESRVRNTTQTINPLVIHSSSFPARDASSPSGPPSGSDNSLSKRASRASVTAREGLRGLVGEGSGAAGDVEVDDIGNILMGLKQMFKYFQGLFLIGRFHLNLPDLNIWFFEFPEWAFSIGFDIYALECIFETNRFLGYMLGKWFSIPIILLVAGVGVLLSNALLACFLRFRFIKAPSENPITIAQKEVAEGASKWSKSNSAFGSFQIVTYVASAHVSLHQYLKVCAILLILSFAILSLFILDCFDCILHPSLEKTHRVFRSIHCWREYHQDLMPAAFFFTMVLLTLPVRPRNFIHIFTSPASREG